MLAIPSVAYEVLYLCSKWPIQYKVVLEIVISKNYHKQGTKLSTAHLFEVARFLKFKKQKTTN